MSGCPSIYIEQLGCLYHISVIFENLLRKFKIHYNPTRITVLYMENNLYFKYVVPEFFLE